MCLDEKAAAGSDPLIGSYIEKERTSEGRYDGLKSQKEWATMTQ